MENKLRKMKKLPLPDQRCLDAAEGWLGLGDHMAANEELEQIAPELRVHPCVLKVQYVIFETAKKWEEAAEIAQTMAKLLPENPWGAFSFSLQPPRIETDTSSLRHFKARCGSIS